LNRLGGIAATLARWRRIPLVVSIHGGVLDLPASVHEKLVEPLRGGVQWGKVFGWLLRSRRVLEDADAIVTCNRNEAALLRERYPDKIIFSQPHGIPAAEYAADHRAQALRAFPQLPGKKILLAVGRIDPVKNQDWLVQELPRILREHPQAHLVLAGACTDEAYGKLIKKEVRNLGLEDYVTLTGGLPPADRKLIGLFQLASAVLLPSLCETFGVVILEAWAAGAPVISSRTSGAVNLVRPGENGWLFDLGEPESFHHSVRQVLLQPDLVRQCVTAGQRRVREEFDSTVLAGRVKLLYEELIGES
jgi:alpha-maltose-1-phosphate synthase